MNSIVFDPWAIVGPKWKLPETIAIIWTGEGTERLRQGSQGRLVHTYKHGWLRPVNNVHNPARIDLRMLQKKCYYWRGEAKPEQQTTNKGRFVPL
jgi:hypothetical protein